MRLSHVYNKLYRWWVQRSPPRVGEVSFGDLRRLEPVSRDFGYDRGNPIDRYYIERFLETWQSDIYGRILEVGDSNYTRRFGGDRVLISDVLHISGGNPQATIVADLTDADHVPSNLFDCIILTQTLHLIYDVKKAILTVYRLLKPRGVLLATFPGISQISQDEWSKTWYWAFTTLSAQRLFGEVFPNDGLDIRAYGNVLSATAFLQGLAVSELRQEELEHHDPHYELLITVRAVRK